MPSRCCSTCSLDSLVATQEHIAQFSTNDCTWHLGLCVAATVVRITNGTFAVYGYWLYEREHPMQMQPCSLVTYSAFRRKAEC